MEGEREVRREGVRIGVRALEGGRQLKRTAKRLETDGGTARKRGATLTRQAFRTRAGRGAWRAYAAGSRRGGARRRRSSRARRGSSRPRGPWRHRQARGRRRAPGRCTARPCERRWMVIEVWVAAPRGSPPPIPGVLTWTSTTNTSSLEPPHSDHLTPHPLTPHLLTPHLPAPPDPNKGGRTTACPAHQGRPGTRPSRPRPRRQSADTRPSRQHGPRPSRGGR
eukprot:5560183-Prymnesium_polylepis.1